MMPSLDCFSYIQRGSSPLVLVDFCGFSGVFFFFFFFSCYVILFYCPLDSHASPTTRKQSLLLWLLAAQGPIDAGASGRAGHWPAPGESRGTRGPLQGRDCLHTPSPWPAPTSVPVNTSSNPRVQSVHPHPCLLGPHGPPPVTRSLHHLPATPAPAALHHAPRLLSLKATLCGHGPLGFLPTP